MIKELVDRFMAQEDVIKRRFADAPPVRYFDIVRTVIEAMAGDDDYSVPDPERIHEIDDGDYQGTLVYVIPAKAAKGYQPRDYWFVRIAYGSCSKCDTLCGIFYDTPKEKQPQEFWLLALHVAQQLKSIGDPASQECLCKRCELW